MFFPPPPQIPDPTVPVRVTTVATTIGTGVQIYTCRKVPGQAPEWQWVYESPEATLADSTTHQPVAKHFKGPTWVWRDGSTVTATVLMKQPAVPGTIPVLLLQTTHPAGAPTGFLTPVAFVRRSEPHGGAAPPINACSAAHAAKTIRVPYTSTYTFYTANP